MMEALTDAPKCVTSGRRKMTVFVCCIARTEVRQQLGTQE